MTAGTVEIVKSLIGRLLGLDGHTDSQETNGQYAPFLTGDGLRGLRFFAINKAFVSGNDYKLVHPAFYSTQLEDFLGLAVNPAFSLLKGSDGTANSAILAATANGVAQLTTGVGSTHTMAVNGAQVVGGRNYLVSNDEMKFEARLKASALTSQSYCFGMIDVTTLSAAFTRTTATTTANGTNGVAFLQDAASTNAKLYAVSVNAGGSPQSVALNVDLATAAYANYRIQVDAAGTAKFYINGALVATITAAVATTAILAPSVSTFSEATSGSQTLNVDYILAQQLAKRG